MIIVGETVVFNSIPKFYKREESGEKTNTERVLSSSEVECLSKHPKKITHIRIENSNDPNISFKRELTDISQIGELLGHKIAVFSWRHSNE